MPPKLSQTRETGSEEVGVDRPTAETGQKSKRKVDPDKRANWLDGKEWLKNSLSIWSDLVKSKEEKELKHPAAFPEALVTRLLVSFLNKPDQVILDPFMGTGSTLKAAVLRGHRAIGFEVYREFVEIARTRLGPQAQRCTIFAESACKIDQYLQPEAVNMVVTSPPYWNILTRRRTADGQAIRQYGREASDLGNINDYDEFLEQLVEVMRKVQTTLTPRAYCVINVMDIRVKDRFYPLHADLATKLRAIGYELDDLIIWDRRHEYHNLRPLGYPHRFRLNRVHEYLLIFQKGA